jgi:hypothetical protein
MPVQEEPGIGDISPVAKPGVEKEPMLLLDTTGSMTWSNTGPHNDTPPSRWSVLSEALGTIVEKLGAEDSQAAAEEEAGEDAGGLMTVTFAIGNVQKIGDLSPDNWKAKLGAVRLGGGTEILPGWNALTEVFLDEFGDTPALDRPKMMALIITDGEANDTDAFAAEMQKVGKSAYVVIAMMGFGSEHDRAKALYDQVAAANDHVRVVSFGNTDDPAKVADAVISMVG